MAASNHQSQNLIIRLIAKRNGYNSCLRIVWSLAFLVLSALWSPGLAQADDPFDDVSFIGTNLMRTTSVAWGDIDGDGDLDLAVGNSSDFEQLVYDIEVYENVGGRLNATPLWKLAEKHQEAYSVAWGDVDGDGDLDLAVGNFGEVNQVYENVGGTLKFSLLWESTGDRKRTTSVAWGDVDGDGDLDLAVGNNGQVNQVYENVRGTLHSIPLWESIGDNKSTTSVAWGDVDSDGDLDLAIGNGRDVNQVYENVGGNLKFSPLWESTGNSKNTSSVAWGDVDGDGDLDLAVGNKGSFNQVFRNVGGTLSATPLWESIQGSKDTNSVAWGDVDGDGDLDLAVGNNGDVNQVYENINGQLNGTALWESTGDKKSTISVAWGDVDGDGDLDLAVGNWGEVNQVYENTHRGRFSITPLWVSTEVSTTTSVAWGDVDGDGDLDLAVGNNRDVNQVYENVGGSLKSIPLWESTGGSKGTESVAWGDVDGDGDLDLAFGNFGEVNQVYENVGGRLSATPLWNSTEVSITTSVAWGDVDGDGDLDLAFGNFGEVNQVYENVGGSLKFSLLWESTGSEKGTTSVAWGDVDGDGDLDLAVGNWDNENLGEVNQVYENMGGGLKFRLLWESTGDSKDTTSVAWGDVDGDGDLDLAVGNNNLKFSGDVNQVYENVGGSLKFRLLWESTGDNRDTSSVAWGDVDGDGDLDLAVGSSGNQVYENVGGRLSARPLWESPEGSATNSVAWGDVDGDGDLDLAVGNWGEVNQVYENTRQGGLGLTNNLSAIGSAQPYTSTANFYANAQQLAPFVIPLIYTLSDPEGDTIGRIEVEYSPTGGGKWFSAPAITDTTYLKSSTHRDGLVGDWRFNSGSGITATNSVTAATDGLLIGSPTWVTDTAPLEAANPYALSFNGVDNYVSLADNDALNVDTNFTIAAWVRRKSTGTPDAIYASGTQPNYWFVSILPTNQLAFTKRFLVDYSANTAILADRWYHVAVVKSGDSGNNVTFYVNGQVDGAVAVGNVTPSSGEKRIGNWTEGNNIVNFDGVIDDVRLYNQALLPREIAALANGKATMPVSHVYTWDTFRSGFSGYSDNMVLRMVAYPQPLIPAEKNFYKYLSTTPGPFQRPYVSSTTLPFRVRGIPVRVLQAEQPSGNALVYRLLDQQTRDAQIMASPTGPLTTDVNGYLGGAGQINPGDRLVALWPITATESFTLYYTSATPVISGLEMHSVTTTDVQTLTVSSANPLLLFNLDVALEWDARNDALYLEQLEFDLQRVSEFLYDWTNGQAALGDVTIYQNREHWDAADIRVYATNALRPHATVGGVVPNLQLTTVSTKTHLYAPGHVEMGATWNRYGEAGANLSEDWARTLAHELGHYLFFLHDNYVGLAGNRMIRVDSCLGVMSDPYDEIHSEFHPAAGWDDECQETFSAQMMQRSDWETINAFYPWLNMPAKAIDYAPDAGPNLLALAVTKIRYAPIADEAQTVEVPTFFLTDGSGGRYSVSSRARAFLFQDQAQRLVDLGTPRRDRVQAWNARPGDQICIFDLFAEPAPMTGCAAVNSAGRQMKLSALPNWKPDVIITPDSDRVLSISVGNLPRGLNLSARIYSMETLTATADFALTDEATTATTGRYRKMITLPEPILAAYLYIYDESDPTRGIVTEYTLGGAPPLALSDGDTVILKNGNQGDVVLRKDGDALVIIRGELRLKLAAGDAIVLSTGDAIVLSTGDVLVRTAAGDAIVLSTGDAIVLSTGDVLIKGDSDAIVLSTGDAIVLSTGDAIVLSTGDAIVLSTGDAPHLVGTGDAIVLSTGDAPIRSGDGQVTLYTADLDFKRGEFYTMQPATQIPSPPSWATILGQAYRVTKSPNAPALQGASITMNYPGRDIAAEKERLLHIYFWPENGPEQGSWQRLETSRDELRNSAVATTIDAGIYVLMYSEEVELKGSGWHNFAYPVQHTQPVTSALESITGKYSIVWGYDTATKSQQFYAPITETWVSDLASLGVGQGYWIYMITDTATLYLNGVEPVSAADASAAPALPAVYYGEVLPSDNFTPTANMLVTAQIDAINCRQTQTRTWKNKDNKIVYVIKVEDCGSTARQVRFALDGQPLTRAQSILWDNTTVQQIPLRSGPRSLLQNSIYLPVVIHKVGQAQMISTSMAEVSIHYQLFLPLIAR